MSDATPLNPEGPPQTSPPPAENGVFQSQSLLFVLLRICIYVVLATGISFALLWIISALVAGERSLNSPKVLTISEVSSLAGAFAAGVAMSHLEGRSFGGYGLPLRGAFGKLFWQGAFFGLTEISAVIGAIATFGSYHFGDLAIHGADLFRWAAFWGVFFVLVGLYEEFAFRGYVQFTLAQAVKFWPAAVLLSAAFGFVHRTNAGESKMGVAGVVLAGLFWCLTLRRTGNLWFAVGMHASFDFGETFLYSVPDSGVIFPGHLSNATLAGPTWLTGGSAGPEASMCDFAMLLIFFYVFHRLYPARSELIAGERLTQIPIHLSRCAVCYTGALHGHFRNAMNLSAKQCLALESICDTFAPAGDGWPSASELGVPDAIARGLEFNPRSGDRAQFLQLLDLWDSRFHSLFASGRFAPFSSLTPEAREWVLLSWADSGIKRRRAAFQALRKAVGLLYVMLPGADGGRSKVCGKLGYPGPLGVQRTHAPRPLRAAVPVTDLDLSCDVCVIGSGAGGATAAAVLAAAGCDVIVLEAGGYFDDADFDGDALRGFERLYAEAGNAATWDQSVNLLAGECLGGGTVVNYCTSFRTPEDVRAEWASAGVPWFAAEEYTRSLDAVCARLSVNVENNRVSAREQILQRGLHSLGWHCAAMPRNVIGCEQGKICGYCGFGCAIGAKQSATKTWLADAQDAGARLFVETRAQRVRIKAGSAVGVEARTRRGQRVTVGCKAAVIACGAIHTPALLLRSGLRNEHIGRHLHLHPVSNVSGIFREEIRPWEGTMQAVYSDQFRFLSGNYGVKYETTALQPTIQAAVLPWREPEHYRLLLSKLAQTVGIGTLLRDRDGGRVTVDREGHAVSHHSLSDFDRKHLRLGFIGAARILEAAGAELIFSPHAKWCAYEPGRRGSLGSFAQDMDAAGWDAGRLALFSFHIMGSARMGGSPKTSATSPEGQTWEVRNLYVMDGSAFPSASGVNPMISIEAIAHRNASALAARLPRL